MLNKSDSSTTMADETAEKTTEPTPTETVQDSHHHGGSLLSRVQLLALLVAVILGECLLALLLVPSPSETAVMAGVAPQDKAAESTDAAASDLTSLPPEVTEDPEGEDRIEVDLGQFSVTSFQPTTNTTLRIEFHLYGTINREDQETFDTAYAENTHRIREQVIVTVRAAEVSDLTDAGLGLIKRRILEKTNRLLGKPLLKSVVVSEFSFIEQ